MILCIEEWMTLSISNHWKSGWSIIHSLMISEGLDHQVRSVFPPTDVDVLWKKEGANTNTPATMKTTAARIAPRISFLTARMIPTAAATSMNAGPKMLFLRSLTIEAKSPMEFHTPEPAPMSSSFIFFLLVWVSTPEIYRIHD